MAQVIANWIKSGTINYKTGLPFVLEDIKDVNIKAQVEILLLS